MGGGSVLDSEHTRAHKSTELDLIQTNVHLLILQLKCFGTN